MANKKRLIDANALLKELRKELSECQKDADEFGGENILWAEGIEFAIDTVKQAKPVDAVEVVRCRDCLYWEEYDGEMFCLCDANLMTDTAADDFCSYGERRTDNGN